VELSRQEQAAAAEEATPDELPRVLRVTRAGNARKMPGIFDPTLLPRLVLRSGTGVPHRGVETLGQVLAGDFLIGNDIALLFII
jgi:hypothetical protein